MLSQQNSIQNLACPHDTWVIRVICGAAGNDGLLLFNTIVIIITTLLQVIVENASQPTLENLYEALGKAYGIPATRVWAIKHNWSRHEWVRLSREMGFKKVRGVGRGRRIGGITSWQFPSFIPYVHLTEAA